MGIPRSVDRFLGEAKIPFDVTTHPHTATSWQTAEAAHVSGRRLAKAVVVKNRKDGRYFVALLPAENRLELKWLKEDYRMEPELASETDLASLFPDCDPGAVPSFGQAYQMTTIWDERLGRQPELWCEAGDHEHLVHLDFEAFHNIFGGQPHGVISTRHH